MRHMRWYYDIFVGWTHFFSCCCCAALCPLSNLFMPLRSIEFSFNMNNSFIWVWFVCQRKSRSEHLADGHASNFMMLKAQVNDNNDKENNNMNGHAIKQMVGMDKWSCIDEINHSHTNQHRTENTNLCSLMNDRPSVINFSVNVFFFSSF